MAEPVGPTMAPEPDAFPSTPTDGAPAGDHGDTVEASGPAPGPAAAADPVPIEAPPGGTVTPGDGIGAGDQPAPIAPPLPADEPAPAEVVEPEPPATADDAAAAEPSAAPVGAPATEPGPLAAGAGADLPATPDATAAPPAGTDDGLDGRDGDGDDEEGGDEAAAGDGPTGRGGLLTREVKLNVKTVLAIVVGLVVVALAYGAYWLGQHQVESAGGTTKTTATTAFKVPKDFTTVSDAATGIKVSIPKDWVQYSTQGADPPLRMVAGIHDTDDSVSLRVNAYSSDVTKDNVADQKNVFDGVLSQQKDINVVVNQVVTVRGLPALFYVYSFKDQQTGKTGIHAHYFVFQGRKMVSMIFQALPPDHPEDRYKLLAPVFDEIINSLEIAPGPPPAFLEQIGSSTTVAGATTTVPGAATATTAPASPPTSR